MDDWFAAERDLFRISESELIDRDGKCGARLCTHGFQPDDVQVTATPDAFIGSGTASHRHDGRAREFAFANSTKGRCFGDPIFPEPIDVDRVSANLDKGMLHVAAELLPSVSRPALRQRSP